MKALIHAEKLGLEGLSIRDMDSPNPAAGEVRVKLKTVGTNHRDLFVTNRHQPTEGTLVLGSDGAGIVDEVGKEVVNIQVGDEVIINPGLGWKENTPAPPDSFQVLGHPSNGTFAEYVVIPAENVVLKPVHLSWEEAGVISL